MYFSDQYLKIGTSLVNGFNIYGLGEHKTQLNLKHMYVSGILNSSKHWTDFGKCPRVPILHPLVSPFCGYDKRMGLIYYPKIVFMAEL